jgi:hypothetical protein
MELHLLKHWCQNSSTDRAQTKSRLRPLYPFYYSIAIALSKFAVFTTWSAGSALFFSQPPVC